MKSKLYRGCVLVLVPIALATVMSMLAGCSWLSGSLTVVISYEGTPIPSAVALSVDTDVPTCGNEVYAENIVVNLDTGGLKNVVVRLEGEWDGKLKPKNVVISNKACSFVPHVAIAMVGSNLKVRNDDPIFHTTDAKINGKPFFNIPLQVLQGPTPPRPVMEAGLIELSCAVHDWMKGYIVVHRNPLIAVSNEEGRLSIEGIPPGKYTLISWHEELGEKRSEVEILGGKDTPLKLTYGGS